MHDVFSGIQLRHRRHLSMRSRRSPRRRVATMAVATATAIAMLLAGQGPAGAQGLDRDRNLRTDLRQDRANAALQAPSGFSTSESADPFALKSTMRRLMLSAPPPPAVPPPPKEFTLSAAIPVSFNTNVYASKTNERSDWHSNPEVTLDWARTLETVELSFRMDANTDRYLERSDADGDELYARFQIAARNPFIGFGLLPFVGYKPIFDYEPTLERRSATFHDLYLGFKKKDLIELENGAALIMSARAGRRAVTSVGTDSTFADVTFAYLRPLGGDFALAAQPVLRGRWYDENQGSSRRDTTLVVPLILQWAPESPKFLRGDLEVDLSLAFAKNWSNAGRDFKQFDAGPALNLTWKF